VDMVSMSKGLTGGYLPMGLTSCTQEIYDAFYSTDIARAFFHGHSYTGNPLSCAAANASLDLLEGEECQQNMRHLEGRQAVFLEELKTRPSLHNHRQTGSIIAFDIVGTEAGYLSAAGKKLYHMFTERGVLLRPLGNTIYIIPPYSITDQELNKVYAAVREVLAIWESIAVQENKAHA